VYALVCKKHRCCHILHSWVLTECISLIVLPYFFFWLGCFGMFMNEVWKVASVPHTC
jgi:hypothetical protein